MPAPEPQDYPPQTRDYGQYIKTLTNLEMGKKYRFPTGLARYRYDFCGDKFPVPGEKKPPVKPPLSYTPSCQQYAPFHSTFEDMSLVQRRLETEPEHNHTWYREKASASTQMRKLGQIREQLDNLHQLFVEERNKCHDLELQLERLKGNRKPRKEAKEVKEARLSAQATPRLNERLLRSSEADKVLSWLTSFDEGGEVGSTVERKTPRKTWSVREQQQQQHQQQGAEGVSRERVIEKWIGFQQGEKESVGDYSERFWKLRLDMQAVQSLSNEEQLRRYVGGLKSSLRNEVITLRPSSLSDAIALAERAETRSLAKLRPLRSKSSKTPAKKPSKSVEPPRKRHGQFHLLTPAQQFQYLNLYGDCSCRKDDETGDRK